MQYIQQVALMQHFIHAERTGNWKLYLYFVGKMNPHFIAAGHLPYAKSTRLYLQPMEALEETIPADEFTMFTDKGYFTMIEKLFMCMMKASGGMMHGQGITDSTITKWVHALPRCVPICDALEQFTGVHTATSEQHKDLRPSTQ